MKKRKHNKQLIKVITKHSSKEPKSKEIKQYQSRQAKPKQIPPTQSQTQNSQHKTKSTDKKARKHPTNQPLPKITKAKFKTTQKNKINNKSKQVNQTINNY